MMRPPGFKNPHQWYDINRALMTFEINSQERYKAYEAGADAYEKGLLSQEHQDYLATPEGESCKGVWVFIPAEKE